MCKKYILLLLLTIALSDNAQSNRSINLSNSQNNLNTECFSTPQIPIILQSNTEKLNFLALHWWDNFAFNNTDCIQNTRIAERAFLDFINICSSVDTKYRVKAINKLMDFTKTSTSEKMYKYFFRLADKYLYDPNSPFRNEEMYAIYIDYILSDNTLNQTEKLKPQLHLKDINKNRQGSKAADFKFITSAEKKDKLYNVKADYILLYFNNPDCEDCKRSTKELKEANNINKLLANNKLKILNLYIDEDITTWKEHLSRYPSTWINARDASNDLKIQMHLYTIRAIPSFYLLDESKTVILKDVDVGQVEEWIAKFSFTQ